MRSICANVRDAATRQSWSGFTASQTKVMHFDKDLKKRRKGIRATKRRKNSCPTNWITIPRSPGVPKCPLPNGQQPQYTTDDPLRIGEKQDGLIYKEINPTSLAYKADSQNKLGRPTYNLNIHSLLEWENTGTLLSWYVIVCAFLINCQENKYAIPFLLLYQNVF